VEKFLFQLYALDNPLEKLELLLFKLQVPALIAESKMVCAKRWWLGLGCRVLFFVIALFCFCLLFVVFYFLLLLILILILILILLLLLLLLLLLVVFVVESFSRCSNSRKSKR
jgi:hypothetical protein